MPAFKKVSKEMAGRPPELGRELIENICNTLRLGAYVETAVVMAGVPKRTFYHWITLAHEDVEKKVEDSLYVELLHAVEKAQEEATTRDLLNIDKCAMGQEPEYERYPPGAVDDDGRSIAGQLVFAGGKPIIKKFGFAPDASCSQWRLERRRPKEWGRTDKLELTSKNGAPLDAKETPEEKEAREKEAKLLVEKYKLLHGS